MGVKQGDRVLDLGSGGGFDCFVAGAKVGASGRVIGVDMTPEMLGKARANVASYRDRTGLANVEFRLGEIEIALDAGAILIPGTEAREPIDELELEWKPAAGSTLSEDAIAERLHAWTQTLRAAVPDLAPLDISKAQRGYQLRAKVTGDQA